MNWRSALAGLIGAALIATSCSSDQASDTSTDGDTATIESTAVARDDGPETTVAADDSTTTSSELPSEPMSADDAALIDAAATAALEETGGAMPGMWVGVWSPTQGVHLAAYGDAVAETTPATTEDSGRIGSVTKTFTATAVLQQVAEGSMSLDDTVADLLPDLAAELPEIAEVTVSQLLSMQSGIAEYEFLVVPDVLADPTAPVDLDAVIVETVEAGVEPAGTAGYSTTNYLILGDMLEAVTGEPVETLINDIATEAELATTALAAQDDFSMPDPSSAGYVNELAVASLQAEGVEVEVLGDVSSYNPMWGGAGGSMYSTISDLGTWASTGFGNDFLPPELAAQRLESSLLPEGVSYGLGIINFGEGWYGHTGEILGWNTLAVQQPETGAVFVGFVNESGSLPALIGPAITAFPELVAAF